MPTPTRGLLAAFLLTGPAAHAQIVPAVDHALAFRGGSIVIPLLHTDDTSQTQVTFVGEDDARTSVPARVIWYVPVQEPVRRWTDPIVPLRVSHEATPGAAHLIVPVPDFAGGVLHVGAATVSLTWHDRPASMPPLALGQRAQGVLEASPGSTAMPSFDDPFEAWRVELIAARRGLHPPSLTRFDDEAIRAVAEHRVLAWRLAMQRLHAVSPGVARTCAEQLTATARDGDREIAAWVTEPAGLADLLGALISTNGEELAEQALSWAERQPPIVAWTGAVHGQTVDVTMANTRPSRQLVETVWAVPAEVPVATSLAPGALVTARIEPLVLPGEDRLLVEVDTQATLIAVNRSELEVTPPGVLAGPLSPPRVLAQARNGAAPSPPPVNRQTFAQFRRLTGAWEVMIESRWPSTASTGERLAERPPGDAVRGRECVQIVVEDGQGVRHQIVVTPDGILGPAGDAVAHIRVFDHAWLCRLVLPEAWIDGDRVALALVRGHGDDEAIETWPTIGTPWEVMIDPITLDLSEWDQGLYAE